MGTSNENNKGIKAEGTIFQSGSCPSGFQVTPKIMKVDTRVLTKVTENMAQLLTRVVFKSC